MNYKSFLFIILLCTSINSTNIHGLSVPPNPWNVALSSNSLLSL